MASEALVSSVKAIVATARAGKLDEAYAGYRALYQSPEFAAYDAADRRQALKIMVHAKGVPQPPSAAVIEAHRAAIGPLTAMVREHAEPADHEMLGMCHVVLGDEAQASAIFRAGLDIERAARAHSDLCGALMRRISML